MKNSIALYAAIKRLEGIAFDFDLVFNRGTKKWGCILGSDWEYTCEDKTLSVAIEKTLAKAEADKFELCY